MKNFSNTRTRFSMLFITAIMLLSFQISAKTFSWTDRGTMLNSDNEREYSVKVFNTVEINSIDICNVNVYAEVKMKGKNSRNRTSLSNNLEGKQGLEYGLSFSYKRADGGAVGKRLRLDGYWSPVLNGKKYKLMSDIILMNNNNLEFDFYDEAEGLDELNRYTEKLTNKCKKHLIRKKEKEDANFKSQKVNFNNKTSVERTKRAMRYLTSSDYVNSIDYNNPINLPPKFVITKDRNRINEKSNIKSDSDIQTCIKWQINKYNQFFNFDERDDRKNNRVHWMKLFQIQVPVFHVLDSRESGNTGAYTGVYIDEKARWNIQIVAGKSSSKSTSGSSECYQVYPKQFSEHINSFYNTASFKKALAKLNKKYKAQRGK